MTNAEMLAKDIDRLTTIITRNKMCNEFEICNGCPYMIPKVGCACIFAGLDADAVKEWLESEVKEDDER